MRAVQFEQFGGPEVLEVVDAPEPHAGPAEVRIVVSACGVNPADWKIREGFMGGELPRGVGLEAAGVVDEVGDEVTDVTAGDLVFGSASAGAADLAVLSAWARVPDGVDPVQAGALPVAAETAVRGLDLLGVESGQTLLVNGGAGAVGTVVTQLAIARGARVIVTASERNAERLRGYGALVTGYGDGLADRIRELGAETVDRVYDMGPGGALPELVALAGGEPDRVITISDFAGAEAAGVRATGGAEGRRWDALAPVVALVADGRVALPIERTFDLEQVAEAQRISRDGHVSGKLVLLVR